MDKNAEEVLKSQLSRYFKPIIEFQEIMKAHGSGLGRIDKESAHLQANLYISTCDEPTIAYYEKLFDITYHFGDSLEFRRERVIQKFKTITPFSIGFLEAKLRELYGEDGYVLKEDPEACTLNIKIMSDRYGAVNLLYDLLWDIVPAHIKIMANQQTTNFVPGRLYAAGEVSRTLVQTIYQYTVEDIAGEIDTAGGMSKTVIKTI